MTIRPWSKPGPGGMPALQRQILDPIGEVFGPARFRDNLQVFDALTDCNRQLMRVNHAAEIMVRALAMRGFSQQIFILGEKRAPDLACSVEQVGIGKLDRAVKLRGEHVHVPQHESASNRCRNMDIHVERDAHRSLPRPRRRLRNGESRCCSRLAWKASSEACTRASMSAW